MAITNGYHEWLHIGKTKQHFGHTVDPADLARASFALPPAAKPPGLLGREVREVGQPTVALLAASGRAGGLNDGFGPIRQLARSELP